MMTTTAASRIMMLDSENSLPITAINSIAATTSMISALPQGFGGGGGGGRGAPLVDLTLVCIVMSCYIEKLLLKAARFKKP
jgi:hypothetical protein